VVTLEIDDGTVVETHGVEVVVFKRKEDEPGFGAAAACLAMAWIVVVASGRLRRGRA
jgi:hypothetical protein